MKQSISKPTFKAKVESTVKALITAGEPARALQSLFGSVLRHDDPFESVGVEDWEALR